MHVPKSASTLLVCLAGVVILPFPAFAADQTPTVQAQRPADDYIGERIAFPVDIEAQIHGTTQKVCLPAHTKLRGLGKSDNNGLLVQLRKDFFSKWTTEPGNRQCAPVLASGETAVALDQARDKALQIDAPTLAAYPINRSGLSYGALMVPFKYHVTGSRRFQGSGSVGPYAGYKMESGNWGASLEIVGFLGLSSVQVDRVQDGKPIKEDLSAFSYGIGAIGRIRENFQVGLVLGADRVSKESMYPDNGKAWIAVTIGYAFSN